MSREPLCLKTSTDWNILNNRKGNVFWQNNLWHFRNYLSNLLQSERLWGKCDAVYVKTRWIVNLLTYFYIVWRKTEPVDWPASTVMFQSCLFPTTCDQSLQRLCLSRNFRWQMGIGQMLNNLGFKPVAMAHLSSTGPFISISSATSHHSTIWLQRIHADSLS